MLGSIIRCPTEPTRTRVCYASSERHSQPVTGSMAPPRVFLDVRERGETCSKHRVARLMRENGLQALHGYRIRHIPVAKPHALIPNLLQRQFTVSKPNEAWVTDITICD